MRYYINDTTISKGNIQVFASVMDLVKYLEGAVQRKFKLTRKQYMENLIELGYGYDDPQGATFTSSLSEYFNIGVVQDGNRYVKTNIHEAARNNKFRRVTGN